MKKPSENELRDLWLKKYHNITVKELVELLPKEVLQSPNWFKLYPCTQQQHDEWVVDCKALLKKKYKIAGYLMAVGWGFTYLQCAPYITKEKEASNGY